MIVVLHSRDGRSCCDLEYYETHSIEHYRTIC